MCLKDQTPKISGLFWDIKGTVGPTLLISLAVKSTMLNVSLVLNLCCHYITFFTQNLLFYLCIYFSLFGSNSNDAW